MINKTIETNLTTIYIKKDKVSFRGVMTNAEHTGSRTGRFSFRSDKTKISSKLKKYMTIEISKYTGEKQIKIKLPKGKYMKLVITDTSENFSGWQRIVGISELEITSQLKKL